MFVVLQNIFPKIEGNLSDPSQAMRCATLRLLCCFEQPSMVLDSTAKAPATCQSSQVFPMFFSIQSQSCTLDSGRQAAVTIGKVRTYLEYSQIPAEQIGAVVRCLLGTLHIRSALSPLSCCPTRFLWRTAQHSFVCMIPLNHTRLLPQIPSIALNAFALSVRYAAGWMNAVHTVYMLWKD